MRNKNKDFKLRSRLIAIAGMLILLILIFSLKNHPDLVETFYSNTFYPLLRKSFLFIFNYIPFSFGDVLYVLVIIWLFIGIYRLGRLLVNKKISTAGYHFLGFLFKLEIALALFYILWASNYFRQAAQERLSLQPFDYNPSQLLKITSMLIDSTNQSRSVLRASDFRVTHQQVVEPAIAAVKTLSSFDPPIIAIQPFAKSSLLSPILNYIGTAGYYNPFTGEAQFNSSMPVFTQPFVACHEMAHQMGFGSEDEANFAGFIAGKSSNNKLLKYSAYYLATQEFMNEVWRTDSIAFQQMKERISPAVIEDLETERIYWSKYQGGAARISSIFYDNYLKANKQPEGLKTYNRMIKLTMAFYRKTGFVK